MEALIPEKLEVAAPEAETTPLAVVAEDKSEAMEELSLKKKELAHHEARLNGGYDPLQKRDVISIDKEVERMERIIKLRTIEIQMDAPINPKYRFEQDDTWRALARSFKQEDIDEFKSNLEKLKEQKVSIFKTINDLKQRIGVLEKELSQ